MAFIEMEIKVPHCELFRHEFCDTCYDEEYDQYPDCDYGLFEWVGCDGVPEYSGACGHVIWENQYLGVVTNTYKIVGNIVETGTGKRKHTHQCARIVLNGKQIYPED